MTIYLRPGQKALRKGRASLPGQIYFITIVCNDRRRIFANWESASSAAHILTETRLWQNSKLLCWVLMPDHWHGLVQLADEDSLSKLMQRVKAVSAKNINIIRKSTDSVWQKCFFDRGLRSEEDIRSVAEYIIANPVRAGLVADIGLYPFWDAYWLRDDNQVL
ncbi:MAG: REP-associated tyrosine transposase [Arenimonas sp.]